MSRPRRLSPRLGPVAGLLAALLAALLVAACADQQPVPTMTIERQPFVHRIRAEGTLRAEQSTKLSVPVEVQSSVRLAWVIEDGSEVSAGDVVARFDPLAMRRRLEDGQTDSGKTSSEIAKTQIDSDLELARFSKEKRTADLDLEHAERYRKTDSQVFSRRELTEGAIDEELARQRQRFATESSHSQKQQAQTQLDILDIQQRQTEHELSQVRQGLEALEIVAPHNGTVTLISGWNGQIPQVGTEMWRGQQLAEIPDLTTMEAEVFVLEADAGGVRVGQPAEVVIAAHPEKRFAAAVIRVDAVAKPRRRRSPVQYFGVGLELAKTDREIMKPGARIDAYLQLADEAAAIVVPRQALQRDNGKTWVYVREGGDFTPRVVELGVGTPGLVTVASGLEESDVIALRKPDGAARLGPSGPASDTASDDMPAIDEMPGTSAEDAGTASDTASDEMPGTSAAGAAS